ncbi:MULTISPECIES: isochorismatase family cysteine hydrolase [Kitasatospora]|uniref:Putative hydrolase n=1 Tax=Kitasatospora setae (strain ATCC 33774 / DSM 43861 / JCM 3304 / KCC A-0304 / NBRC 14216 / KM-6054) TaxID=452652 RepID=E4N0V5_KITSK|nr:MULTISPECIES: isochorismatase family cysteine hydrolase [Kitasatospora]BAJ31789.1 putative hydrolase [Kitasatospora setae KM-6054]
MSAAQSPGTAHGPAHPHHPHRAAHRPAEARRRPAETSPAGGAGRSALVVVDLQNDFCAGEVARSRFPGDPALLARAAANSVRAVERARAAGTEVLFVRFLGDPAHQGPAWRRRDARLGKRPKCLEGSWGAEFHGVRPRPQEAVFTKHACFDAFQDAGFEPHLRRHGIEHLVLAGVFTDVCVDSTARTAFQRGFHLTVLRDCTTALHLADADILRFMNRVYGARITELDRVRFPGRPSDTAETPAGRR